MTVRAAFSRLGEHVVDRHAPPATHDTDAFLYGLSRPASAVLLIIRRPQLLRAGLLPALWLAVACALFAYVDHGHEGYWRAFYRLFAYLAPFPSVLFARHYARMAVTVWSEVGGGPSTPWIEPVTRTVFRTASQTLLISFGLAPLMLLRLVHPLGEYLFKAILALWALHWIVVDAFDSARVLLPGQTIAEREAAVALLPAPWFVRFLDEAGARIPGLGRLLRRFGRICDRLSRPWRDEIALIAERPVLMTGFALTTALLLCTPVLNLLFRPIILVAAANVIFSLSECGDTAAPVPPPSLPTPGA